MRTLVGLLILLALSVVTVQAATPTISNVSGTVETGQTLTITGTNMWNETTTDWDAFFDAETSGYEGASIAADGYGNSSACANYSTAIKLMGNQSINPHFEGYSAGTPTDDQGSCAYGFNPVLADDDIFLRIYTRWDVSGGWPNSDYKFWWLGGGSGSTHFLNLEPTGTNPPTQFGVYGVGSGWHFGDIPSGAIQNDRWYLIEMQVRKYGAGSYVVRVWVDNALIIEITGGDAGGGVDDASWGWESLTNYWNTTSGHVSDLYQDGFVVSSTRVGPASLVEIGDSATYATATKAYQEPTTISDTSNIIVADLAGLGAGPYYLFVTNDAGETSAAFSLSGEPPDPPDPSGTAKSVVGSGTSVIGAGTLTVQ